MLDEWRVNGNLQNQMLADLKHKLQEEKTLNKILTDEHANLAVVIDKLKKDLARVETDNEILTRKYEAEKEILEESNLLELTKSQKKQKKTRLKLKRAEETITQLEQELARANQDSESLVEARDQMYLSFY